MVQNIVEGGSKPRGRPRSYDVDTALEQARNAFWRNGYAATSLDDLSAATGLNRPSLYGAFGDKHALYLAALGRSRDEMLSGQARGLANPAPLRETLTAVYAGATAIYLAGEDGPRGCFLIGTAVTESRTDPEVKAILDDAFRRLDAAFAERFAASRAELPPAADPEALGRMASAVIHSLAVRSRSGADEPELRAIYKAGVDLICGRHAA